MEEVKPIYATELFPVIDKKLVEVLTSLSDKDWEKQTIAPLWKVRDVASHLLDGNIRTLSMSRDNYFGSPSENTNSYHELVRFLNKLNSDWITAMKRVSPKVLVELLEITNKQAYEYVRALNPFDDAIFSVAWAGEQKSKNWFHIAREYTEKWHHQQQIRLAVGQEKELFSKQLYFPYLEISMRALPYHYRTVKAGNNGIIKFIITGEGGGVWTLYSNSEQWSLVTDCKIRPACEVLIKGEIAWRIFTKGIEKKEAKKGVIIKGNNDFGNKIFDMLAVMA